MNDHLQQFMEISAAPELAGLSDDKRAAWVWSADGSQILWANAAGAAFFSVKDVSSLAQLAGLNRSPARTHITRIAASGPTDRMTIDRLRFYRGLRVMLLTCQCRRLSLSDGTNAALILCGDQSLCLSEAPLPALLELVSDEDHSAFVLDEGALKLQSGTLQGTPELLSLPENQSCLFGPLALGDNLHEGAISLIDQTHYLVVLENSALPDVAGFSDASEAFDAATDTPVPAVTEDAETIAEPDVPTYAAATVVAQPDDDTSQVILTPTLMTADVPAPKEESTPESEPLPPLSSISSSWARAQDLAETEDGDALYAHESQPDEDGISAEVPLMEDEGLDVPPLARENENAVEGAPGFQFTPRRRPIRFAWKMDINQRFTFISDEFGETLGPVSADVVGLTWADVARQFDLDVTGSIARALDRRDTWSGKSVDWPVTGTPMRVPVDMAALPAFDRNREFEGYRGFGVCRTADAVDDPMSPLTVSPVVMAERTTIDDSVAHNTVADQAAAEDDTAEQADVPPVEALSDKERAAEAAPDNTGDVIADRTRDEAPASVTGAAIIMPDLTEPGLTEPDQSEDQQTEASSVSDAEIDQTPDVIVLTDKTDAADMSDLEPDNHQETADETDHPEGAPAGQILDDSPVIESTAPANEDATDQKATLEAAARPAQEPEAPAVERANELREAPKAPLEGRTLLGASTEALLGAFNFKIGKKQKTDDLNTDHQESIDARPMVSEPIESTEPKDQNAQPDQMAAKTEAAKLSDILADTHDEALVPDDSSETETLTSDAEAQTDQDTLAKSDANTLTGISGTAPLKPREIETAVKTLAKDYGRKVQNELPLLPANTTAMAPVEPQDLPAEEDAQDTDTLELTHADEIASGVSSDPDAAAMEENPARAEEPLTQDELVASEAIDDDTAVGIESLSLIAGENDNGPRQKKDEATVEEKSATPAPVDDGKVVSITRKPRLVPVDTSRLSRPEKAAFRKIAEALGARLEGDIDDGEEEDELEESLQQELDRVNLPPQAGPIDPRLLDRLPIGIAIAHDRDVLYANDTLFDLLGYEDLKALTEAGGLEAVFVEDDNDDAWPDADGMEGTVDGTLKVRLAGGGVRAVDARMHTVPWNGSRGLMISITERNTAKQEVTAPLVVIGSSEPKSDALQKAEDRISELDTILETATDGVLVLDQYGTILKVNRSAEALFGASRSDIEGAPLTDYLAPESHRAAADYLDGLSRNGVASILNDGREVLGRVSAGGLIPLFMTIGRVSTSVDDQKFCAVLRDITQWKTAEEELTQAKRQAENASSQKSDFLAKISHEIRTPLNAIIGFSEVMMEERFGPIGNERYKEYLKDIRTSGSHIMSLINDLLDLSKIEAGKMELRFSAVSANDVISECVALMQPQANRDRVIIRASLPDSVPSVVADQRSLRQIVLNLLSNAIKFNKSGGQVIVSTSLEDSGEVVLRVRDTGTGMSAKDLTAALEPFRQVHTARHGGGTGLGLPLTKALVEANRAGFQIDSTPDQGTLVEIRFPSQRVLAE